MVRAIVFNIDDHRLDEYEIELDTIEGLITINIERFRGDLVERFKGDGHKVRRTRDGQTERIRITRPPRKAALG